MSARKRRAKKELITLIIIACAISLSLGNHLYTNIKMMAKESPAVSRASTGQSIKNAFSAVAALGRNRNLSIPAYVILILYSGYMARRLIVWTKSRLKEKRVREK